MKNLAAKSVSQITNGSELNSCRWPEYKELTFIMSQVYFEIQATKPERAIRFYQATFNWQFAKMEGLPVDYWKIGGDKNQADEENLGGLLQRPANTPPMECGTNAFVCSFEVNDFDQTAKVQGGQAAMPKFAVPKTCWQGYFIDTEGNTFGIFQPDENAG